MLLPHILVVPIERTPLWVIERAARLAFSSILKAHPGLFERLGDFSDRRYGFRPSDLPLDFMVVPESKSLSVTRRGANVAVDACVEGPLLELLCLLEGRSDGDALFFSRALTVTGDMEAILALRNALDDSNIDLPTDLGAMAGIFSPLVSGLARSVRNRALAGEQG